MPNELELLSKAIIFSFTMPLILEGIVKILIDIIKHIKE